MIRFQEKSVWETGKFTVDNSGAVWRGRVRAEKQLPTGYMMVRVMVSGVRLCTCAHRLVWHALRGPIPVGYVINHLNGVKNDNRPRNLECVPQSINHVHAHAEGLVDQRGEKNPAAKISDADVARIRLRYAEGGITQSTLAVQYGVTFQAISKIVRGTRRASQLGRTANYEHRRRLGGKHRDEAGRYIGKSAAGRLLDGVEHNGFPTP